MTKLKHFSMLVLLAVAAQGAWGQTEVDLTLYDHGTDAASNSSLISGNNGKLCNVTLSGRTLYKDGDWNTLCLPFNMKANQISVSSLAGATIKEFDSDNSNLTGSVLTLTFKDAPTTEGTNTIDAGKPYIVKWPVNADLIIRSAADWSTFADKVAMAEIKQPYAGIVKLAADISITEMVGGNGHSFAGTFDGCGHTIHCDITDTFDQGVAPFYCIEGATIKNLKVTGSVNGGLHCAGLVGFALRGTNNIKNCWVDVNVTCNGDKCGGILGHGHSTTTTISDCLFSGTINGGTADVGIFCGWSDSEATITITNCLAHGTYNPTGYEMINGNGTKNVQNCYKKSKDETTSDLVSSSGLGSTEWEVVNDNAVPKMTAIVNPVFPSVTIANTNTPGRINFNSDNIGTCAFRGNYAPLTIDNTNCDKILLFASGNRIGYAKAKTGGTYPTLNPFRAYFEIPVVNGSRAVHSFVLDFGDGEETGITAQPMFNGQSSMVNENSWYTLDGRRLDKQPTKAGLYINNGRKVIIK